MQLEVSFRKARKKKGWAPWCVDTRKVLTVGGAQKFFATKQEAQFYAERIGSELVDVDTDAWDWDVGMLRDAYMRKVEHAKKTSERSKSNVETVRRHLNLFCNLTLYGQPLKEFKVIAIRKGHIEEDLMEQLRVGRSKKTVQNYMGTINSMFKFSVTKGCRATNPCFEIEAIGDPNIKPKPKTKGKKIDPANITQIINAMDAHWRLITTFAANIGLRQGEQRCLTWGDISFEKNSVYINKAVKHRGGVGSTKTEAGVRNVPLPRSLKKAMQEYYFACGRPASDQLIFTHKPGKETRHAHFSRPAGCALEPNDFLTNLQRACDKAGVERITWHDLRHFAASMLLIKHKEDWWAVSGILGHEQESTTKNIYGHHIAKDTFEEEDDLLAI